jgi:hypothetical protein
MSLALSALAADRITANIGIMANLVMSVHILRELAKQAGKLGKACTGT